MDRVPSAEVRSASVRVAPVVRITRRCSHDLPHASGHRIGVDDAFDPVAARAEIRPGSRTGPFRSQWHGEVATRGLLADERAQARALFENRCRRGGHARTLGCPPCGPCGVPVTNFTRASIDMSNAASVSSFVTGLRASLLYSSFSLFNRKTLRDCGMAAPAPLCR